MEANAGLVAGSHKRNELVRIRHDSDGGVCVFTFSLIPYVFELKFDLFV